MSTHTSTAIAGVAGLVLGAALSLGATASTAETDPPAGCAAALEHASHMAELVGERYGATTALQISLEEGWDTKADRIAPKVAELRTAYLAEQADYAAAAATCRG